MNGRLRAMLFGAGAVVSAAVIRDGLYSAVDRVLIGEALNRQEPRTMVRMKERLKGNPEDSFDEMTREYRQRMESAPHETVQLTSFDGTSLVGHLFRAEKPRRVVLAMHGWRSGWARDFCLIHDFLHRSGCTVLYPEQRGQGSSDGKHMGFGLVERFDCLAWANWLNDRGFRNLPMYLAGISMGAATVLMAAGSAELPGNVRGIVADCGFTSPFEIWRYISERNLHMPYRGHRRRVDALCRKRIHFNSDDYSTLEAMKSNVTPVLFIHGEADTFVPAEMSRRNYDACKAPKKLLLIPGAEHGMSYVVDQKAYEAAVEEFWAVNDS